MNITLSDCVEITHRDGTFLLKPKKDCEMDLVLLGFDGTEKWIRLQCVPAGKYGLAKGEYNYTATICQHDNKTYSWYWGWDGYTLVSISTDEKRKKIVEACKAFCEQNRIQFPGMGR